MLTDFYEITMATVILPMVLRIPSATLICFSAKFRTAAVICHYGRREQLVNYLSELSFTQEDIDSRSKHIFREEFDYLKNFKLTCDVWPGRRGTPIFPVSRSLPCAALVIQAQFVETMYFACPTTRASSQRRQTARARCGRQSGYGVGLPPCAIGFDGAIYGARAGMVGGWHCSVHHQRPPFRRSALGTMAHSWCSF